MLALQDNNNNNNNINNEKKKKKKKNENNNNNNNYLHQHNCCHRIVVVVLVITIIIKQDTKNFKNVKYKQKTLPIGSTSKCNNFLLLIHNSLTYSYATITDDE